MENKTQNKSRNPPRSFRLSDRTIAMIDHVKDFSGHKNRTELIEEAVTNYCIFMTKRSATKCRK